MVATIPTESIRSELLDTQKPSLQSVYPDDSKLYEMDCGAVHYNKIFLSLAAFKFLLFQVSKIF